MGAPVVTYRQWSAGDWVELRVNDGLVYAGHSIPDFIFLQQLEELAGVTVREEEVNSDEDDEC